MGFLKKFFSFASPESNVDIAEKVFNKAYKTVKDELSICGSTSIKKEVMIPFVVSYLRCFCASKDLSNIEFNNIAEEVAFRVGISEKDYKDVMNEFIYLMQTYGDGMELDSFESYMRHITYRFTHLISYKKCAAFASDFPLGLSSSAYWLSSHIVSGMIKFMITEATK